MRARSKSDPSESPYKRTAPLCAPRPSPCSREDVRFSASAAGWTQEFQAKKERWFSRVINYVGRGPSKEEKTASFLSYMDSGLSTFSVPNPNLQQSEVAWSTSAKGGTGFSIDRRIRQKASWTKGLGKSGLSNLSLAFSVGELPPPGSRRSLEIERSRQKSVKDKRAVDPVPTEDHVIFSYFI